VRLPRPKIQLSCQKLRIRVTVKPVLPSHRIALSVTVLCVCGFQLNRSFRRFSGVRYSATQLRRNCGGEYGHTGRARGGRGTELDSWTVQYMDVSPCIVRLGSSLSVAPNTVNLVQGKHPRIPGGIRVGYGKSGCSDREQKL